MKRRIRGVPLASAVLLLAACSTDQPGPTAPTVSSGPSALGSSVGGIAPTQSRPHGRSYSE